MKKEITHIDLFSGVGGIATGMHAAGLKTLAAVEKVQSCVESYRANHLDTPVIHKDVRKVTKADFSRLGIKSVDLVTAGMPCETFSTAGATSRSFYDHRQTLFSEAIRIAKLLSADYILLENVPALLTKKLEKYGSKYVVELIYEELESAGFINHKTVVLNSADFGVPQNRERLFIFATTKDVDLVTPQPDKKRISIHQALIDLPKILANQGESIAAYKKSTNDYTELMKNVRFWKTDLSVPKIPSYHIAPKHRPQTLKRFSLIEQGEGLRDLFKKHSEAQIKKLQEEKVLPKKWYIQRNRRLLPKSQAPTVTSHCIDEFIHPTLNRALTVREIARLQSFPDWYDVAGGPMICPHMYETQDKYEQLGDAVPPLVAYHWGNAITSVIKNAKPRKISRR